MNYPTSWATFDTAIGRVTVTASAGRLLAIVLPQRSGETPLQEPPAGLTGLVERLKAYFRGGRVTFRDDEFDLNAATPFQVKVWEATRLIPYGETRSYRWVAERIGQPGAARAVGQALGSNPLPVVIPCHRVVAGHGRLGGYSGGLEMKRHLLRLEKGSPDPGKPVPR